MSKKDQDLNEKIIKDRRRRFAFRRGIYSRVALIFLLILIQILIFTLFIFRLESYLEVYFGASIVLSTIFMSYLSNSKGKNEFKLSWLVLVVIFPLLGISIYSLCRTNWWGLVVNKKIKELKIKNEELLPVNLDYHQTTENFPEIENLCTYLVDTGNFFPHTGCKVKYFPSGESFYEDFIESLKNAKKFIFLEYFIIDIDESWKEIFQILEEKAAQGVEIRILYDGLGSVVASSRRYQKFLASKGFKSHIFMPLIPFFSTPLNNRDHRKITIIDGEIAYTGGLNIANEYFNRGQNRFPYWKDNAIRVEGSAIFNLTELFLQTWNIQIREPDDYQKYLYHPYTRFQTPGLCIPYGDDYYNKKDIAEDVYKYIINHSTKYLHITTPYFIIDNQMQDALIFAAKSGVDVKIIVPSRPDHLLTFYVGKTYLKDMADNGVKIFLYQKGFMHAKTFISDDKIATVGSVNLDYRSLFHHFECGTVLYDSPVVNEIEADFESCLKDSVEMKSEDYKKIPFFKRMIGRGFRIFSPLL